MDVPLILAIAVGLVAVILFFKVLKGVFRVVFSILGFVFLLLGLLSIIAYIDAQRLQDLASDGDKVLLFADVESVVLSGVRLSGDGISIDSASGLPVGLEVLGGDSLSSYGVLAQGDSLNSSDAGEELVLLVFEGAFNDSFGELVVSGISLSEREFVGVMTASDPVVFFAELVAQEQGLSVSGQDAVAYLEGQGVVVDAAALRSGLFVLAFSESVKVGRASFVFDGLKSGDIVISPELLSVKLLRFFPDGLFSSVVDRLSGILGRGVSVVGGGQ